MSDTEVRIRPLLKIAEVAVILKVGPDKVRQLINEQKIGHVRIGRAIRIPEQEAERVAASGA